MNLRFTGDIDIGTGVPLVSDFAPDLPVMLATPNERQWTCANMEKIKRLGFKPKYSVEKLLTNNKLGNIINIKNGEKI